MLSSDFITISKLECANGEKAQADGADESENCNILYSSFMLFCALSAIIHMLLPDSLLRQMRAIVYSKGGMLHD